MTRFLETRPTLVPLKWTKHSIYVTNKSRLIFHHWTLYRSNTSNEKPSETKIITCGRWVDSFFLAISLTFRWSTRNIKEIHVEMKIEPECYKLRSMNAMAKWVGSIQIISSFQMCLTVVLLWHYKLCVKCETACYLSYMCVCDSCDCSKWEKIFSFTLCWFIFHRLQIVNTSTLTAAVVKYKFFHTCS